MTTRTTAHTTGRGVDICMCEPFVLPGLLPTLGTPTLKAALAQEGFSAKVFYPSARFFAASRLQSNHFALSAIDNIPLQFSEFLFSDPDRQNAIDYVIRSVRGENDPTMQPELQRLQGLANAVMDEIVQEIAALEPKVICHSFTFGDYNFALTLFQKVKRVLPHVKIIVGGSNCTPEFAQALFSLSPEIDYAVCDETYDSTLEIVCAIIRGNNVLTSPFIATRQAPAHATQKITTLENLPCPNFDDFMQVLEDTGLNQRQVILPYEISRGCWWGEKKPCAMCGYFGNQTCFLIKPAEKVCAELHYLKSKYQVSYFRLTDLVQPRRDYLRQLKELGMDDSFHLFWETRPNLTLEDVALLRSIGLFYAQTGLESLSTGELKHIHKGTTGINNIFVLINFYTFKIHCVWNYLYGFEEDQPEWYLDVIQLIPKLYHLQPPDPREVWINKCSQIYAQTDPAHLQPIGDNVYYGELSKNFNVFFKAPKRPEMIPIYQKLVEAIQLWKAAFSRGFALYEASSSEAGLCIVRDFETREEFHYTGLQQLVYTYFYTPHTIERATLDFELPVEQLSPILSGFLQDQTMIKLDGKFLSLATRSSPYRWQKFQVLPNSG